MGFQDDREGRDNLGPPPDPFRFYEEGRRPPAMRLWIGVGAAALVAFFFLGVLRSVYVDALWFDSVGFSDVYRTELVWRAILFIIGATTAATVLGVNIAIARRLAPRGPEESFIDEVDPQAIRRITTVLLVAGTAFIALIFGAGLSGSWDTVLSWANSGEFGLADPEFGRDAGFYVFQLPGYHLLQGWLATLFFLSAVAAGAVYGLAFSLQRFVLRVTPGMRIHLAILAALLLTAIAFGFWLSVFDLMTQDGGIVAGATYTDVNARAPARYVLAVLTVLVAAATVLSAVLSTGYRMPAFVLSLWAMVAVAGGVLYPSAVESFQVVPNELQTQSEYIARNIRFTRAAYGLDNVEETSFPARPQLTSAQVDANPGTIDNVRLWDPTPLRETFNQIQSIRPFYTFVDVDVDRYTIKGRVQQVMLSARELDVTRAGADNWTRQRLQLTHGFGAVVTPVNEARDEGLPVLITRDIPPASDGLPVSVAGSRIYFGERTDQYVIVRTGVAEFDYPQGEDSAETRYEPERGIPLSSAIRRMALAWELGDTNLLISNQVGADSRVLMRRSLQERLRIIAPFIRLDADPYATIIDSRIVWVQDGYTTSNQFPYAQHRSGINYIRNSVKITVDAVTGDTVFYLMQPDEPVAATWAKIFPTLFTPATNMPAALREHLRYPEAMFKLQADIYLRYHVTDPRVFFLGEDAWSFPTHQQRQAQEVQLEPYYVTMRLPGERQEEFILVMPFTPRNKQNTVGWLAGRSDGDHYGRLRAYRFPTDTLVYGPAQIESRIDQTPGISQQLTLWNQSGSSVIRGNLLMIPIEDSFLFVEPIYLQAEKSPLPELKRVIVANGNFIAMESSFRQSLDVVMGRRPSTLPGVEAVGSSAPPPSTAPASGTPRPGATPSGSPTAVPAPGDLRTLLEDARKAGDAAQSDLDRLRRLLDQIDSQSRR
ncbi:MAG: UPF0182 family protein [Chloroflexi bacterium]|nr:MAG: UPF0182 family protein [Chloroflexota bacterium]